jgi:uncharacterized protein
MTTTTFNRDALPVTDRATTTPPRRWWHEPMVWLVIAGPLSVVVASIASAVIAWKHIDPVIMDPVHGRVGAADDVAEYRSPKDATAPAQVGRNHASTPQR